MIVDDKYLYSALGFVLASLMGLITFLVKQQLGDNKAALSLNTELTRQNTLAIQALTIEIKYVNEKLGMLPELKKDVDGLGEKVRNMTKIDN